MTHNITPNAILGDTMLLRTTVGVFVNLMADNKSRLAFKNQGGVLQLINILNMKGMQDWSLHMLVCQALWNYCIEITNLYELFSEVEVQELLKILADYLGKKIKSNTCNAKKKTSCVFFR